MANLSADFTIKLALILVFSVLPSLIYLLISNKAKKRWQNQLQRAQIFVPQRDYYSRLRRTDSLADEPFPTYAREGRRRITKYFIGDISCVNNAQSPYIRCAINPDGPCDGCHHYEKQSHQRNLLS